MNNTNSNKKALSPDRREKNLPGRQAGMNHQTPRGCFITLSRYVNGLNATKYMF